MTFNPHDILTKIRKNEFFPIKSEQPEKRSHFVSASSSASNLRIVPQSCEKPPCDQEYIGSLLNKIQSLETRVNSLEIQLVDSKNQINDLKSEKIQMENEVIFFAFFSFFANFFLWFFSWCEKAKMKEISVKLRRFWRKITKNHRRITSPLIIRTKEMKIAKISWPRRKTSICMEDLRQKGEINKTKPQVFFKFFFGFLQVLS